MPPEEQQNCSHVERLHMLMFRHSADRASLVSGDYSKRYSIRRDWLNPGTLFKSDTLTPHWQWKTLTSFSLLLLLYHRVRWHGLGHWWLPKYRRFVQFGTWCEDRKLEWEWVRVVPIVYRASLSCSVVAATACLIYDIFITFDQEVCENSVKSLHPYWRRLTGRVHLEVSNNKPYKRSEHSSVPPRRQWSIPCFLFLFARYFTLAVQLLVPRHLL